MERGGYVYIMSNKNRTVLYIGVTSNLANRVFEHKNHLYKGFTSKYNCTELLYFEGHSRIEEAIQREKQMKKWNRAWKLRLIQEFNSTMDDLADIIEEFN
jgi:putative endonuclease